MRTLRPMLAAPAHRLRAWLQLHRPLARAAVRPSRLTAVSGSILLSSLMATTAMATDSTTPPAQKPANPGAAATAARPATPVISQDALLARQASHDKKLLVLDVRRPDEFAAGHVPGAVNVPHDQLATRLSEVPRD